MRYLTLTAVGLSLTAATAFGQQPSGRNSATPQREQRRESDSSFIAREWAVWNAIKDADSAAVVRAVGSSPSLFFVYSGGLERTSAAKWAGQVARCDTRSHRLDMFNVVHPNDDTAIVIYRVTLARSCGTTVTRGLQQMATTVWARRDRRWEALVQTLTPLTVGDKLK